jgi:large subunit ribosomal protein L25
MQVTVECQKRPEGSKPKALRREGFIPASLYGHDGANAVSLVLKTKDALTLLKQASVNNTLVDLKVPEINWNGKALIREVQAHPWKKNLYHLSFFSVAAHGAIEVTVPLNLVGNSKGSKEGGILEQLLTEVKVSCLPDRIPESIDIDMSTFDIGSSLHIKDLALPQGATALEDGDHLVFSIMPPTKISAEDSGETEA